MVLNPAVLADDTPHFKVQVSVLFARALHLGIRAGCGTWSFQLQLLSNVEYQIKFTKYSQVHGISKSEATSQKSKCHTFAYQKSKMGVWAKVHRGQSEWLNGAMCGVKAALPSRAVGKQGTSHTTV